MPKATIDAMIANGELFTRAGAAEYCNRSLKSISNYVRNHKLQDEREQFKANTMVFSREQLDNFKTTLPDFQPGDHQAEQETATVEPDAQQAAEEATADKSADPQMEAEPEAEHATEISKEEFLEHLQKALNGGISGVQVEVHRMRRPTSQQAKGPTVSSLSDDAAIQSALARHLLTRVAPGGTLAQQHMMRAWHSHIIDNDGETHCYETTFDGNEFHTWRI